MPASTGKPLRGSGLASAPIAEPSAKPGLVGAGPGPFERPRALTAPDDLRALLRSAFGFADFRPFQEQVCRAATEGRDLLLVMPTGAGKSLCYQLPGLARGGTTLVVSPLIALMDDQCAKLKAQGFCAERIHSGRGRAESRAACVEYLAGRLDFLFIAPERLRVPGFPEMLAKRPLALIAVDEAHCISEWGHDFRPDYRLLGERLPTLRPAPIVALTATATPDVQDDIVAQLGLEDARRFIHGFRRHNLAIETVEIAPGGRADAIRELLAERARRPAIVYAATRKNVEELATALGRRVAAGYHAGMDAAERERVQSAFLSGALDVIVATTAFGMGIDKADVRTVVHAALPGSVEGYYQEIGRAGRDGKRSIAVLMHSFVDRKTHEYLHDRDYPDASVLAAIYAALAPTPRDREGVRAKAGLDAESFERALEKLAIHRGAVLALDGTLTRGEPGWKKPYLVQRDHKLAQLRAIARYAESHGCRMRALVRHFGDQEDADERCGLCDACAPEASVLARHRAPSAAEQAAIARILSMLAREGDLATGRLHREGFADGALDRRNFEHILGGLVRAGLVEIDEATFEKDGKEITYQRASLTPAGRLHGADASGISLPKTREAKPKRGKAASAEAKRRAFFAKQARRKKRVGR